MAYLCDWIAYLRRKGHTVITMGDFNISAERPTQLQHPNPVEQELWAKILQHAGADIYRTIHPFSSDADTTFCGSAEGAKSRIDYVFISTDHRDLDLDTTATVGEFGISGMDHAPVIVSLSPALLGDRLTGTHLTVTARPRFSHRAVHKGLQSRTVGNYGDDGERGTKAEALDRMIRRALTATPNFDAIHDIDHANTLFVDAAQQALCACSPRADLADHKGSSQRKPYASWPR